MHPDTSIGDVLYWSMLAASTIGPGSVVILSKSGAQFDLKLAWTVLVGAAAAFVMSEGAGRLYLISGHDLGGAMRVHFGWRWPAGLASPSGP